MLVGKDDWVKVLEDGVEVEQRAGHLRITQLMTVSGFKKAYRHTATNQAIYYHLKPDNDKLDYYEAGGIKLIVINKKAVDFKPGDYYGTKKTIMSL